MGLFFDHDAGTFKIAESTSDDEREVAAGGTPALATDGQRSTPQESLPPPRAFNAERLHRHLGPAEGGA
eukprot:5300178-Alexandrium_andersonii.AAC.1